MRCLRCLCVQCRDPMNLVDIRNGVSVLNETGKLFTVHNDCVLAWLKAQLKSDAKPKFQIN